ncbi:LPXTG cell wall anchor domain-containing protein [Lactobacillus amylovorus]|uniref:LPXTG cell wall anchor domain-containing protein n=1 Tax=Lactobacillus amylovorus TaxID=1604 RepID=UPI00224442D6|nr:collagen-binding domain-containing protein [Lactobacillus amylovorus]
MKISNGHFMGSILTPNAVFDTGFNVDGNIVAKEVTIGGENHRWDWMMPAYPVVPNPQPEPKPTPNSDPEQPNFFPPASKDSDEPETPQFGEPQAKTHLPDAGTVSQAPATNNNEEVFFQPQAKRHFGKAVLTDKKTKTVKKAKTATTAAKVDKPVIKHIKVVTPQVKKANKKVATTIPQTGQKQNHVTLLGLVLGAASIMIGFFGQAKKE